MSLTTSRHVASGNARSAAEALVDAAIGDIGAGK